MSSKGPGARAPPPNTPPGESPAPPRAQQILVLKAVAEQVSEWLTRGIRALGGAR